MKKLVNFTKNQFDRSIYLNPFIEKAKKEKKMSISESTPFVTLHESPLYVMEQSHRFNHISELSNQLQKVTKLLGHYTNLGGQLISVLKEIIDALNTIEFVCTSPAFTNLMDSMKEVEGSLQSHFNRIKLSSEKAMKKFIKNEIPALTELKRNHVKLLEKYLMNQEKVLAISKKNKKLYDEKRNDLDDMLKESTQTFYDYVKQIEIDETQIEILIGNFLLDFPKSFVESTKNLKPVDETTVKNYLSPKMEKNKHKMKEQRALMVNSIPTSIKKLHSHFPSNSCILTKQGFLFRKKKSGAKKWTRNVFSCSNGFLSYSKTAENAHNPSFTMSLLCASVQVNDTEDRPFVFNVVTPSTDGKSVETLTLQALTLFDYEEWLATIRSGILYALEKSDSPLSLTSSHNSSNSSATFFNLNAAEQQNNSNLTPQDSTNKVIERKNIPKPPSMRKSSSISSFSGFMAQDSDDEVCADCGAKNAKWIIANRAVSVCDNCAGVHRGLSGVSIIKSIQLDKVDIFYIKLRELFPNNQLNIFYEYSLKNKSSLITPTSPVEDRQSFIERKYIKAEFASQEFGENPANKAFDMIREQDAESLMKLCFLRPFEHQTFKRNFTPLHAASIVGNPLIAAIIVMNSIEMLNQVDDYGWVPLSYATFYNHKQVVEVLLSFHPDLNVTKDAHPCQISLSTGNEDILNVFNSYVAMVDTPVNHAGCFEGPFKVHKKISERFKPAEEQKIDFSQDIQQIEQQNQSKNPAAQSQMSKSDMLQIQKAIENMGKNRRRNRRSLWKEEIHDLIGELHE